MYSATYKWSRSISLMLLNLGELWMDDLNGMTSEQQFTHLTQKLSDISIDLVKVNTQLHLTLRSWQEKQLASALPTTQEKVYLSILDLLAQTDIQLMKRDCSVEEFSNYYLIKDPS